MFTLILVTAEPGFFFRAGSLHESPIYVEAAAADALRIARSYANDRYYHAVGIRVGKRAESRVLWVK